MFYITYQFTTFIQYSWDGSWVEGTVRDDMERNFSIRGARRRTRQKPTMNQIINSKLNMYMSAMSSIPLAYIQFSDHVKVHVQLDFDTLFPNLWWWLYQLYRNRIGEGVRLDWTMPSVGTWYCYYQLNQREMIRKLNPTLFIYEINTFWSDQSSITQDSCIALGWRNIR